MLRFLWIYLVAVAVAVGLANSALKLRPKLAAARVQETIGERAALAQSPAALSLATEYVEGDRHGAYFGAVEIDGRRLRMLIDTGATLLSLTHEDADALGIRPAASAFKTRMQTANGISSAALVWLPSVRVGRVEVRDVQAAVLSPGASSVSLLGMSFLQKLHRFGVADGRLVLEQ